mmetsp:Transcript_16173/g.40573  ORF Transcript_16173/g.40573 Transcript_16173/m.40573 type:complete len:117 (+) Transcript_16173:63-413(+)
MNNTFFTTIIMRMIELYSNQKFAGSLTARTNWLEPGLCTAVLPIQFKAFCTYYSRITLRRNHVSAPWMGRLHPPRSVMTHSSKSQCHWLTLTTQKALPGQESRRPTMLCHMPDSAS